MLRSICVLFLNPYLHISKIPSLYPGAHILSGNVLEPRALDELLPDWRTQGAPVTTAATDDRRGFSLTLALTLHLSKSAARLAHAGCPGHHRRH